MLSQDFPKNCHALNLFHIIMKNLHSPQFLFYRLLCPKLIVLIEKELFPCDFTTTLETLINNHSRVVITISNQHDSIKYVADQLRHIIF